MSDKADYFNTMYGYAREAGLPDHLARLAVTQSALETGYGKSVKGNNYFGIKAGRSWKGPVQSFKTWESVNGKRVNIIDRFRKYDDPKQSFKDWAKTVERRWPGAITAKTFGAAIDGLKPGTVGGYASDEKYKEKLTYIDRRMQRAIGQYTPIGNIPIPTPRNPMAMMAQAIETDRIAGPQFAARAFNPGGIINSPAVSLNPVSSATASERMAPKDLSRSYLASIQARTRQAPQTSAPAQAKTSTGISFSRATPAMQSMRQTAQMSVPDNAQMSVRASPYSAPQAMMRDRAMPSGPISSPASPVASPASMMAGYQQYGQTRAAAPVNAPSYSPVSVTAQAGTMTTPAQEIPGPVSPTIQAPAPVSAPVAPVQKQTFAQKIGKAFTPQNIQKAGLTAVGTALGGPVGGLLAGFLGNAMIGNKNPQAQGLLSGLFSGQGPMQSTYIGSGINAVTSAMGSDRRGDTARYNSQGGGFITNLGGGSYQRTSDKHGWTETTDNSGHTGISYGGKKR